VRRENELEQTSMEERKTAIDEQEQKSQEAKELPIPHQIP